MKPRHYILLFFFYLPMLLYGQYSISQFQKYTVANGLSDNVTNSILQDDRGYIWIATMNGLNRYDGRVFENFYTQSNTTSISGNRIHRLKTFSSGGIGVLSSKGFSVLNTHSLKAVRFEIPDSTRLWFNSNDIWDAIELPGQQYAFTGATGFYVAGKSGKLINRFEYYTLKDREENKKRIFFGNTIFSVSKTDYLLYYRDTRLAVYNAPLNKFTLNDSSQIAAWKDFGVSKDNWTIKSQISPAEFLFLPFLKDSIFYYNSTTGKKTASPLPFKAVNSLYWDSYVKFINDSTFTINCYRNGFYLFTLNRNTGKINVNPAVQLPEYECRDILSDKEGRLWVCTSEGVLMEKKSKPYFPVYITDLPEEKTNSNFNTCICKYKEKLFIGRYSLDNGVLVYDSRSMQLIKKVNFYAGNNRFNGVFSIQSYHKDTLWIATEMGLLWMNVNNYQYGAAAGNGNSWFRGLRLWPPENDSMVWFTSYRENGAIRYHIKNRTFSMFLPDVPMGFPSIHPKFAVQDSYGNTWFAGTGLSRWNSRTHTFDTLINKFSGRYPLENNIVGMIADNTGSLWLSLVDNGLLEYNIKEHKWISYSEKEGLPNGIIASFSPIAENEFWFGCGTRLFNINTVTKKISQFNSSSGLPENNLSSEEEQYYYDKDNQTMYFAIRNYFTQFPARLNPAIPGNSIVLKEAIINNQLHIYFPADTIVLTYKENQVSLQPGIVDFENGSYFQYKYRIDNNKEWNQLGQVPVIFLDKLEPGNHFITIHITGTYSSIPDKVILIIIRPPFWKTTWFLMMMLLLVSTVLFILYRLRISTIRKKALLNQRLAEFEMKALHAQMNPHFIFNCLNSIKGLIINDQRKEASEYLTRFSSLVRKNLEHSRMSLISLKENIDYLKQYIEIETLRYGNLHYHFEVAENMDTDEIKIAPMLLQPLVENAIWHGLQGIKGEKKLLLNFSAAGNTAVCRIEDNGIGIKEAARLKQKSSIASVGLQNIRERIQLLNEKFGLNYKMEIEDKSDNTPSERGTVITLSFTINQ
jgi:ligand-binding sensor domain-containing protein/two-component sensor histidine kinase